MYRGEAEVAALEADEILVDVLGDVDVVGPHHAHRELRRRVDAPAAARPDVFLRVGLRLGTSAARRRIDHVAVEDRPAGAGAPLAIDAGELAPRFPRLRDQILRADVRALDRIVGTFGDEDHHLVVLLVRRQRLVLPILVALLGEVGVDETNLDPLPVRRQ